jgi:hypothetical protein
LAGVPNARHDDQADALSQLFRHPPLEPVPVPWGGYAFDEYGNILGSAGEEGDDDGHDGHDDHDGHDNADPDRRRLLSIMY